MSHYYLTVLVPPLRFELRYLLRCSLLRRVTLPICLWGHKYVMTKAFAKTLENYIILYEFNIGPYIETKSYTTSKTFVPDPVLKNSHSYKIL